MRRACASAVVSVLAGLAAAPARAGWWDEAADARATTIADVRRDPAPWRDVVAVLDVKFVRAADVPAGAPFSAADWRAIEITAPSAPYDRLLVRRGTPEEARLETLSPGAVLRVRAVVRDHARGADPWMETLALFSDGDGLTPEEETRADRAKALLRCDNAPAAEKVLRELLAARTLEPRVRADLLHFLGRALSNQTKLAEALAALKQAHELAPQDRGAAVDLERVAEALRSRIDANWKSPPATTLAPPTGLGNVGPSIPKPAPAPAPESTMPRSRLAPPAGLEAAPEPPAAPPAKPAAPPPPAPAPAPALAPPR